MVSKTCSSNRIGLAPILRLCRVSKSKNGFRFSNYRNFRTGRAFLRFPMELRRCCGPLASTRIPKCSIIHTPRVNILLLHSRSTVSVASWHAHAQFRFDHSIARNINAAHADCRSKGLPETLSKSMWIIFFLIRHHPNADEIYPLPTSHSVKSTKPINYIGFGYTERFCHASQNSAL